MDESDEVFQDFGSDDSDFDDDVDWHFTDGESASILQLMGGAESTKKPQRVGIATAPSSPMIEDAPVASNVAKYAVCITTDAVKAPTSEEKLLDKPFPEAKPEFTTKVEKSAALQVEEELKRTKECEVEWALMALEEHDQMGRQSRSASPTKGDADFVSLFEEMYGGGTAIVLSTPSPVKAKLNERQQQQTLNSKESDEQEVVNVHEMMSSPEGVEEMLPAGILDMLQLVYKKGNETHGDFASLVQDICSRLHLPDHAGGSEPFCSLGSCVRAVCSLEESLNSQDLVNSFAPTRDERLELILVALDDKIGALPHTTKIKWAKIMDMLPLLMKMREQTKPSVPASIVDLATPLPVQTAVSPPPKPKEKEDSLSQGWATFHPEKMPARRCESMKMPKAASKSEHTGPVASSKKPRVRIRQYLPTKLRVRCKVYNPEDSELTFRPKINNKYLQHRRGEHMETFTTRMERDISLRRSQKLQHDQKRDQRERDEADSVSVVNLIAKGSQRILLKNGTWAESLEERLHRLAKHRTSVGPGDSRSKKRRQRHEHRKREAAAVASRACESLYQRGVEQRRREQMRLQEDDHDLEFQRNRPKINNRSLRVMKTRIRQELAQLCLDSQRTGHTETSSDDEVESRRNNNSSFVTFIQFSCALLYFGFVADLNTPWEGSANEDNGNKITLLWHSWTVLTREEHVLLGSKLALKVLESVLFSVILGERNGNHSVLRGRDVQTLLRLYRANYYARKHTQLKDGPSDGHKQTISQAKVQQAHERQTHKRVSVQRQRVRYTLHGKPIRSFDGLESDFLSEREHLLQEKIDQLREAKAQQELEGCTFHPRINPGPAALRSAGSSSSATVSTFERLYSDAFQRQNNVLEKYLEAKLHREELEKRECRVQPSYVNGLTIGERLENLHVALADNALPVDFNKKIDAMRTATEMKALDEQLKEQRLLPAHFKRAQDGRTIVLPFQFATEIRATMSSKLKKQRTKAAHRPQNHVMKSLRPLVEEEEGEVQVPAYPPLRKRDDNGRREEFESDLCLDVHLSPSETRQLHLNVHDDPREVVERFAQRCSLTNTQRHFLIQLVEARLEQIAD
ncbi:hypothetical protein PHYPSEUDO_009504 [Phytophthora pseudosyringae]|uniref:Uncharacterized protein n=1 Tax=Phytophthora pseudosyringae TaxID=221518 RepID=A0A8T1VF71_9STRA|nr:hypothetical protein PHYPSEUDO_009504 [Phytophthora pseudosyringae]